MGRLIWLTKQYTYQECSFRNSDTDIVTGEIPIDIQEALLLYDKGLVSLARAAELAGISCQEMSRQARAVDIQPQWSEKMVEEELA